MPARTPGVCGPPVTEPPPGGQAWEGRGTGRGVPGGSSQAVPSSGSRGPGGRRGDGVKPMGGGTAEAGSPGSMTGAWGVSWLQRGRRRTPPGSGRSGAKAEWRFVLSRQTPRPQLHPHQRLFSRSPRRSEPQFPLLFYKAGVKYVSPGETSIWRLPQACVRVGSLCAWGPCARGDPVRQPGLGAAGGVPVGALATDTFQTRDVCAAPSRDEGCVLPVLVRCHRPFPALPVQK